MCEVTSWIPHAVVETLRDRSAQPVLAWLTTIRASIEEYDPLVVVRPQSSVSVESESDSAFDEILSQLGKEIYKLDEYQRNLAPNLKNVSVSIMNIFDECLEGIDQTQSVETETKMLDQSKAVPDQSVTHDNESSVEVSSVMTSTPVSVPPAVPPRKLKTRSPSPCPSYDNMELKDVTLSDSDSESTCWSYQECNVDNDTEPTKPYEALWSHSSGYHNSDEILRCVLSQAQQRATISRLSFDTASDFSPQPFNVYALQEVGGRWRSVAAMTPDKPCDDGYEPVRDALTDENIYEEIEYGYSYTDEGCSCGGSVEVESCSISASSDGVGRESPLYANLRDHDAYAVPQDVISWKNMLLDPYYNEDEEDEWITPEECEVYSRERRPPLVIPRITQYRPPRTSRPQIQYAEETLQDVPAKSWNWSPTSERSRLDLERSYTKPTCDNSMLWANKRLGGSTENLLAPRRPNQLQLPASSSGDSLDVEVRERDHHKERNARSLMMMKHKSRPVASPRTVLHAPIEATVLFEGPVKRTKFFEGGKKAKKNWTDCYMILTPTALVFYKDQRTYIASKSSGSPPSPGGARAELVLPLRNAHVLACIQMHTRRYTRSLVLTVEHDQYLLQTENEDAARRLLATVHNVIYKLGPPTLEDRPSPYQSSSTDLESLGRTPPVARHNRKQKDEPVFGRRLEEVCPLTPPRVPEFVRACVREIEASDDNMATDGLYRASGNLSQVQKIRLEIDQNNMSVIENSPDIHVLTGSLKLFFRELKEPLIPCCLFDRVLAACSIRPREARIREFRDIVQSLPQCNRDTLKFLLEHLLKVTQYSERNRMHTANLAIVFGPTLLWAPAEQAHNIAIDCIQQNNVVDVLLTDFREIFDGTRKKT
ncbi:unnamed protein product [Danaus chrysippus]|uniref:(African queen) hypothetical protein n=1 Tax=Danaus chrysippus TaxID=151541 RepID=A0A8J2QBK9_9NEOP|nr:unnamed protein product [Danaus chrysippus]